MKINKKLKHVSSFLNNNVYELITNYLEAYSPRRQELLVNYLVTFVELLREPLNSKNSKETALCLSYIRSHICKRRSFSGAKQCFSYFLNLTNHLVNEGWFGKSTPFAEAIENSENYAKYRFEVIPEETINKIKHSPLELFANTLNSYCSPEISQRIQKYLSSFQTEPRSRHRAPLTAFLKQISRKDPRWYEKSSIIQNELLNFIDNLNSDLVINNRTTRFNYTKVTNILSDLIKQKLLPQNTILPACRIRSSLNETFDKILASYFSPEISQHLKNLFSLFKTVSHRNHRASLVAFLKQIPESHTKWYTDSLMIHDELLKYNEIVNTSLVFSEQSPRSSYNKVTNILSDLIDNNLLPHGTILPKYKNKKINNRGKGKHTESLEKNIKYLSTNFSSSIYMEIVRYSQTLSTKNNKELISDLVIYINLLSSTFNKNNSIELSINMIHIRNHLCHRFAYSLAKMHFSYLLDLIHSLIRNGDINKSISLPNSINSASEHASYRSETIPKNIFKEIKLSPSELFDDVLSSSCSKEISQHINKYLSLLKPDRHIYRHRNPLIEFLNQASESHSNWYEHPSIIESELSKFRRNLDSAEKKDRSPSANYVTVTNILSDLIKHDLLPKDTILPLCEHKDYRSRQSDEESIKIFKNDLINLSSVFKKEIYNVIDEYFSSLSNKKLEELLYDLMTYIELLHKPINDNDIIETSLNLTYIRIHFCQKLAFSSAKSRFLNLLKLVKLVKHLIERGILEGPTHLPKHIRNIDEYEGYKVKVIPKEVINKIDLKLSAPELFDNTLSFCCSFEVARTFTEHIDTFKSQTRCFHRVPLAAFLNQITTVNSEWYNQPSIIQYELKKYNQYLNSIDIKSRPTSRSQYLNVKNALSSLIKNKLLPKDTHLPNFKERPTNKISGRPRESLLTVSEIETKLKHISICLSNKIFESVIGYIQDGMVKPRPQKDLVNDLITYIELFAEPLNKNNTIEILDSLNEFKIHLCQRFCFSLAKRRASELLLLLEFLIRKNIINELNSSTKGIQSIAEYELFKNMVILEETINRIFIPPSALELFNNILHTTCPPKIATRLNEHVNSFKKRSRKAYRKPIVEFLIQVYACHSKWYEHPKVIQGELIKYRGILLDKLSRPTAYRAFINIKNAISVLIEQDLLPRDIQLPDNLRKATNVDKERTENPLIAQVDLFDETRRQSYMDTPTFIQDLKSELSLNLKLLVREAQIIVHEKYKIFLSKDEMIARSQLNEYINDPEMLVINSNSKKSPMKINPFSLSHPLANENRVAYYDYYFDSLITNTKIHKISNLGFRHNIFEYFGLTPLVSSAMQLIITEELGINPYSLYNAKVSSDGHNQEFVQVDNEGNVRIKTLKARAKHVRTKTAKGSLLPLSCVDTLDIDASICLKMALEMGARTRESMGIESLWTCLLVGVKAKAPSEDAFQSYFSAIREQAYLKSGKEVLNMATLKKIRCSKGILIYLESNGNSLKSATYYGNQVQTTLNRYIPKYLAELIYRVKIRSFQNIFLFMAVASDESPFDSLGVNEDVFKKSVIQAFSNPDMGGKMFEQLSKPIPSKENCDLKYFCVSDKNIQLALKYAKSGTDKALKANCEAVLSKISEGPVIMKKMLRKAHLTLKHNI